MPLSPSAAARSEASVGATAGPPGHGSVTVAHSLKLVVARAIWAEMNAKLQTEAMRIAGGDSGVNYLTPGEATGSMTINETVVDRPWDFWKARAKVALAGLTR